MATKLSEILKEQLTKVKEHFNNIANTNGFGNVHEHRFTDHG